jgi:hypothetical protein
MVDEAPIIEYAIVGDDQSLTLRIMRSGWLWRSINGGAFTRVHMLSAKKIPRQIEIAREGAAAGRHRIVVDNGEEYMSSDNGASETGRAKDGEAKPEKPLRVGANFTRTLDQMLVDGKITQRRASEAEARAREIARERGDTILRDYYLWLALEEEMPEQVQKRWHHFQTYGKEMSASVKVKPPEETL